MKKISYIIDFEKIKHNIFMKNFTKCILFLLLLINYKGFAQCDSNNFTVTPTQGICNSKITVTAPNCDTWNAILYRKNSNNIYEEADIIRLLFVKQMEQMKVPHQSNRLWLILIESIYLK